MDSSSINVTPYRRTWRSVALGLVATGVLLMFAAGNAQTRFEWTGTGDPTLGVVTSFPNYQIVTIRAFGEMPFGVIYDVVGQNLDVEGRVSLTGAVGSLPTLTAATIFQASEEAFRPYVGTGGGFAFPQGTLASLDYAFEFFVGGHYDVNEWLTAIAEFSVGTSDGLWAPRIAIGAQYVLEGMGE